MRTTLTLDDDVAKKLRELAHRRKVPFKDIVNAVLRRGLAAQELRAGSEAPFRVDTFRSAFRPGVDPLKLNQLNDARAHPGSGTAASAAHRTASRRHRCRG